MQQILKEILKKRGVTSDEDQEEFLSDTPQRTYDPFLLLNMEAGVDFVISTIESFEGRTDHNKICIYGDYDADGITATVLMRDILRQITDWVVCYIPSRFDEGYGLNCDAIRKLYDSGVGLIITVDCGSVSVEEAAFAESLGLKILVTDHHRVTDKIAGCLVINPNQPGCPYPFKGLAGCGVAYKFAQALTDALGLSHSTLISTLDLVAVGTVADVVPLLDENRTLVKYGIRLLNQGRRESLNAMIRAAGLHEGQISAQDIAFGIAPRLNAAGRVVHAAKAAQFLIQSDGTKLEQEARELEACNQKRRAIQDKIQEECEDLIRTSDPDSSLFLLDPKCGDEGINGIVAGHLKEKYWRPVLLVKQTEDGEYKGSGRSVPGIDLYELLKPEEERFRTFGGHAAACGFTLREGELDALRKSLMARTDAIRKERPELFVRRVEADAELEAGDVRPELVLDLAKLEPCGKDNPVPVVAVRATAEDAARMGTDGKYLRFRAALDDGRRLSCVAFRFVDELEETVADGGRVLLKGTLALNHWNGQESLQMQVREAERLK